MHRTSPVKVPVVNTVRQRSSPGRALAPLRRRTGISPRVLDKGAVRLDKLRDTLFQPRVAGLITELVPRIGNIECAAIAGVREVLVGDAGPDTDIRRRRQLFYDLHNIGGGSGRFASAAPEDSVAHTFAWDVDGALG
jgi:hypothetical protein